MAENKRYYFLQMPEDFFTSKRIKKLRKLAGGDTFTIIYLKMQLKAMNNHGCLEYDGLEDSIADEIATDIDEDAENVKITLAYLEKCNLLEIRENGDCYLPYAEVNVGSITASSLRSRASREKKNVAMQQQCNALATNCNGDIRDKSIDIDIDIDIKKEDISSKEDISKKKPKEEKHKYGEFKNVLLKDSELEKLNKDYGEDIANHCISYLDTYIEEKGYKSKSHYLAIRRWVLDAVQQKQKRNQPNNKGQVENDALQDFLNS